MAAQSLARWLTVFAMAAMVIHGLGLPMSAQVLQATKQAPAQKPPRPRQDLKAYEDTEIKVAIPAGWQISPRDEIDRNGGAGLSLGNSVRGPGGTLLLEKSHYILAIAYDTSHASGVEGGRFIEIFNIPWPDVDDGWECSGYLSGYVQPASRILTFNSVIVDSGDARVQKHCGIRAGLGHANEKDGSIEGERRWFGGFFTTAGGGYFFDSSGDGCGQKAYTLTYEAITPAKLPAVGDLRLKKIIEEAIDVVNSIHYKRCPPARP